MEKEQLSSHQLHQMESPRVLNTAKQGESVMKPGRVALPLSLLLAYDYIILGKQKTETEREALVTHTPALRFAPRQPCIKSTETIEPENPLSLSG